MFSKPLNLLTLLLTSFLALFAVQSAFAFWTTDKVTPMVVYEGKGKKIVEGSVPYKALKYTVTMKVERLSEAGSYVKVRESYQLENGEAKEFIYIVSPQSPHFFRLHDVNLEPIGHGYCFALLEGKKCHYVFNKDGKQKDLVFTVLNNEIYRMGNKVDANSEKNIIWREGLIRKTEYPQPSDPRWPGGNDEDEDL